MTARTDRAVQAFLDSLSQVPGSVLYRTRLQWEAVTPTTPGQILALGQDLLPQWQAPPTGGGGPVQTLLPIHHYDISRETYSDGQSVTNLNDWGALKSALTNTSGNPTFSAAENAIIFNGINDALQPSDPKFVSIPMPYTWVLVSKTFSADEFVYYLGSGQQAASNERPQFYHYTSEGFDPRFNAGSTVFGNGNEPFPWTVWTCVFDRDQSELYRNTELIGTGDSGSERWQGFTIGNRYDLRAGHFANMFFRELAGFGYRLTTDQREGIIQALASKWSISI